MKTAIVLIAAACLAGCEGPPEPMSPSLATAPATTEAAPAPSEAERQQARKDFMAACSSYGDIARQVMAARQDGFPMKELMERLAETEAAESETVTNIIAEAYAAPRYTLEEYQERTITEFENTVYLACLKKFGLT